MKHLVTVGLPIGFPHEGVMALSTALTRFGPVTLLSGSDVKLSYVLDPSTPRFTPDAVLDALYPILTGPGTVTVAPFIEDPEGRRVFTLPPVPAGVDEENPWWVGHSNHYDELRPEITKMITEWRDEDGSPSELADWFVAMLTVGVERARKEAAAELAGKPRP